MYYFYDIVNQGHVVCQLYGGSPYLGNNCKDHIFNCDSKLLHLSNMTMQEICDFNFALILNFS